MAKFDTDGLDKEWDASLSLRARLRAEGGLLLGALGDFSISWAVNNMDFMTPLLVRSSACNHKAVEVEGLREQVEGLLRLNQREVSESDVDDCAWELRKLLTFMKRKATREEVSSASYLNESGTPERLLQFVAPWSPLRPF